MVVWSGKDQQIFLTKALLKGQHEKAKGLQRHNTLNAGVVIGLLGDLIAAAVESVRDEGHAVISRVMVVCSLVVWRGMYQQSF